MESSAQVGTQPARVERVVQAGRHPALEEAGDQDLVEVGVLDAHRGTVGTAQALPVDDRVALGDAQRAGHARAGLLTARQQRLRLAQQPATGHLLGVAEQAADLAARAGDEGAAAGDPLEQTLDDQRVHRLAHGHPGHAEAVHQLALRRRGGARGGVLDQGSHVLPDLDVLERPAFADQQLVHARQTRPDRHVRPRYAQLLHVAEVTRRTPPGSRGVAASVRRIRVTTGVTRSRSPGARRAGPRGAPGRPPRGRPITTVRPRKIPSWTPRHADRLEPLVAQGVHHRHPEAGAEDDAQQGAQHRDHHRLQRDHAPQLRPAHPDGPQQPHLAGALDDREGEGVDDAEHGDHQRQPEQREDHPHQLVDRTAPLLGEGGLVLDGDDRVVGDHGVEVVLEPGPVVGEQDEGVVARGELRASRVSMVVTTG